MYDTDDYEVVCIASKEREIVDCHPSEVGRAEYSADVYIMSERCGREDSLFRGVQPVRKRMPFEEGGR